MLTSWAAGVEAVVNIIVDNIKLFFCMKKILYMINLGRYSSYKFS